MNDLRPIEVPTSIVASKPDAGPAPMLQWLKIADLCVDETYQRELKPGNWKAIRRIAQQFTWSRFSPVFVAPIEGGKYAIIDGQHRTHAAAMCGFLEVPCQIVQMTREEQAASFAAVNGLVTKVTPWNILRAAMVAGEPWAVTCAKVCSDAGCTLMTRNGSTDDKKPGEIYALAMIRKLVAAGHGQLVTLALDGLRRSDFGDDAAAYSNEILRPVLSAVTERPWLLKRKVDLAPFFDSFDIYAALDRAVDFVKVKRRAGVVDISRWDIASADVGEGLDKMFPDQVRAA